MIYDLHTLHTLRIHSVLHSDFGQAMCWLVTTHALPAWGHVSSASWLQIRAPQSKTSPYRRLNGASSLLKLSHARLSYFNWVGVIGPIREWRKRWRALTDTQSLESSSSTHDWPKSLFSSGTKLGGWQRDRKEALKEVGESAIGREVHIADKCLRKANWRVDGWRSWWRFVGVVDSQGPSKLSKRLGRRSEEKLCSQLISSAR